MVYFENRHFSFLILSTFNLKRLGYMAVEDIPLPDGNLPGDVMVSILCTLPVKPLLKFKSVSKRWYSCITSLNFIKTHLLRHSLLPHNFPISFGDYNNINFGHFPPPDNHDKNNASDTDILILESPSLSSEDTDTDTSVCIIDSCNGFVCLYSKIWGLFLWNPVTTKLMSLELPHPGFGLQYYSLGLCYVEATNDYKIMGWTETGCFGDQPFLFGYELSEDYFVRWDYGFDIISVQYELPSFVSGCMHWLGKISCPCCDFRIPCSPKSVIIAIDVTNGAKTFLGVPGNDKHTLVIRGCLSILTDIEFDGMGFGFEIWVMEEYGVESSWVQRFSFRGVTKIMAPLMSMNDGKIVYTGGMWVMNLLKFVDPSSEEEYCIHFRGCPVWSIMCRGA